MSFFVKLGLWAILLVGIGSGAWAVVHTYNTKIAEAAENRAKLEREKGNALAWMQSALHWQEESARRDKALAIRDRERAAISAEVRKLNGELETAKRQDPDLRRWSDAPLPAFVIEQLRSISAEPGSSDRGGDANSRKPDSRNPDAPLARFDKR